MPKNLGLEFEYPMTSEFERSYSDSEGSFSLRLVSSARLPTRFGDFEIYGFLDSKGGKEHTAIVKGHVKGRQNVPVRVHSECHTGDVMGSLRCDCRDQLEAALSYIEKKGEGAVLYLKQEGRGIGLINKIKAYNLQDQGFDTVDANLELGLPAEARTFEVAHAMLELLHIESVILLSNNPLKFNALKELGVVITGREPILIKENIHSTKYLKTKKERMSHLL